MSDNPLSFAGSLETVMADAGQFKGTVRLVIRQGNQFWFVLPDGLMTNDPRIDVSIPFLRFTTEGRRATILTRMAFMQDDGLITDMTTGSRLMIEFRPCILVGRDDEGRPLARLVQADDSSMDPQIALVGPAAEPEALPDIGALLHDLQETRGTIDTIDTLLGAPDTLLTQDDEERRRLREMIAATRDQALAGLERLNGVLARATELSPEEVRDGIHEALTGTIEAMISFDSMADHVQEAKRREMESMRRTVEAYFARLDPRFDAETYRSFSAGINEVILSERREDLEAKAERLSKNIETSYNSVITALQKALGKGSKVPLIPHPHVEPEPGCAARIVLNFIHVVMAVRYSGLSILLDTQRISRRTSEIVGWDATRAPRLHIVDVSRYRTLFVD